MKVICFASSPAMPRTEATRLCTARRRSDGPRKHAAPEPVDGASSSCAVSRGGCAPRILATKCPRRTPSGRGRRGAPPTSSPRARFAAFSRAPLYSARPVRCDQRPTPRCWACSLPPVCGSPRRSRCSFRTSPTPASSSAPRSFARAASSRCTTPPAVRSRRTSPPESGTQAKTPPCSCRSTAPHCGTRRSSPSSCASSGRSASTRGRALARAVWRRPAGRGPPHARAEHLSRARAPRSHLLVPAGDTTASRRRRRAERVTGHARCPMTPLAPHLTAFLGERLPRERRASAHTCDAYAYAFRLLLSFTSTRLGTRPSALMLEQLDVPLVLAFLEDLEKTRANSPRTRNARLAAIKSFARFVEYRVPSCLQQVHGLLAIPSKKTDEALVGFLTRDEMQAVLDSPDPRRRDGVRDRAMLHLAFAAGLRVSELVGLRLDELVLQPQAAVHVRSKGRRERVLPLWKTTA